MSSMYKVIQKTIANAGQVSMVYDVFKLVDETHYDHIYQTNNPNVAIAYVDLAKAGELHDTVKENVIYEA